MATYKIPNFSGGLNESVDSSLIQVNEASHLRNCDIANGSLKPSKDLLQYLNAPVTIARLMVYSENGTSKFIVAGGGGLYKYNGSTWDTLGTGFASNEWDSLNYNYNGIDVMILVNGVDNNKILTGVTLSNMKDRRISYDALGVINGYYDADGVLKATEGEVTTLAPKAKYVELHYERIWLADDKSVYFSKDFDPQDFTVPTDEVQANQHGGEIVMESFDATKIIGLKVVYDDVVVFKEKSLFKITGAYAEQYSKTQIATFEGAISNSSIAVTSGGAFFLNIDGIYTYDGTQCYIVSRKLSRLAEDFDSTVISKSVGCSHNGKYIITLPTKSEGWLTVEYDYVDRIFTVHDIEARGFLEIINTLYAHKNDSYLYKYGEGAYLPMLWEGGNSDLQRPDTIKEVEDIYFTGIGSSVSVSLVTERKTKMKAIALSNAKRVYKKSLVNYGRMVQFKFSTVSGYAEIIGFQAEMDLDED